MTMIVILWITYSTYMYIVHILYLFFFYYFSHLSPFYIQSPTPLHNTLEHFTLLSAEKNIIKKNMSIKKWNLLLFHFICCLFCRSFIVSILYTNVCVKMQWKVDVTLSLTNSFHYCSNKKLHKLKWKWT